MALEKKDKEYIEKTFSRYAKIIGEEFISQIRPIGEIQQEQGKKLDRHEVKIDTIFEMVAKNTVDISMIKSDINIVKK